MTITYLKGTYRLNAQSRDANELIQEMTTAIKILVQDVTLGVDNESNLIQSIISNLREPTDFSACEFYD